jgi:hypothetical protein
MREDYYHIIIMSSAYPEYKIIILTLIVVDECSRLVVLPLALNLAIFDPKSGYAVRG